MHLDLLVKLIRESLSKLPPEQQIITLDGFSGVGSSTIAKILAWLLGAQHVNAGAFYRLLAVQAKQAGFLDKKASGLSLSEKSKYFRDIVILAKHLRPVCINGLIYSEDEDVTQKVTSEEAGSLAAIVSPFPDIRKAIKFTQKRFACSKLTVLEGRVAGHLCPDAVLKVWLHCDPKIRAERRHTQTVGEGGKTLEEIYDLMVKRDRADRTRDHDPAVPVKDALVLSTEHLSANHTVETILMNLATRLSLSF